MYTIFDWAKPRFKTPLLSLNEAEIDLPRSSQDVVACGTRLPCGDVT